MNRNGKVNLFDGFTLDLARGRVTRSGEEVHLRRQTYEVLKFMVENRGHLISKDTLIEKVWGGRAVTDGSLGKCIEELRSALGPEAKQLIRNVRGRGYIFETGTNEVEEQPARSRIDQVDVVSVTIEEHEETEPFGESSQRSSLAEPVLQPGVPLKHIAVAATVASLLTIAAIATYRFFVAPAVTSAPITSIAVLPFKNESGNVEVEYLSDGISEILINRLSQLPQLKVIARNSAFEYKGKDISPREASRALSVQAILLGRVAQHGDNLVLSVELMDARDRTQVWGERYVRKASDIQDVQEEMASTISEKLRLRLSGVQQRQLTTHLTQNPQAYQFYLSGLFHFRKGLPDDQKQAMSYFTQAVMLDPDFALAWVGVAQSNRYLSGNSLIDPKEALGKAKAAAQKALDLDESLADAYVVLAGIKHDEWDWAGAERDYKRAIELNPNLVEAHVWYANYLSLMERHAEAIQEIKRAQELDPLDYNLERREAWTLSIAGRLDEALEKYEQLKPGVGKHFGLGFAYEQKGMYEKAAEEFRKGISVRGETTGGLCYLGFNLAMSGRRAEAQAILERLKTTKDYVSPEELAGVYVGLGDNDAALAALEKGYAERDVQMQVLKVDWRLNTLRSDPRFQDLLRRVGLS